MTVSLGMVKIEAFDDRRFIYHTIRVCHTDHTDSIIACIAGSFDLINVTRNSSKIAL